MHPHPCRPAPKSSRALGLVGAALALAALLPKMSGADNTAAVARADSLFASQAWSEAAAAYAPLVQAAPDDGRLWYRYGVSLLQADKAPEAVVALEKAEAIGHHPAAMYNLACALTRVGQQDTAIDWLEKAMAAGFSQLEQLDGDTDLQPLHDHPRWGALRQSVDRKARPCAHDERYRELEFWIGDWDVKTTQGQPAGDSHVEGILGSCVIFENWTGFRGMSGKSFNFIDPVRRVWKQTWVDDKGDVHEYEGTFTDGAMRFRRESKDASGATTLHKMSLIPLSADHVRQLGESSTDAGATWTTQYDLHYFRKAVAQR